MTTQTEYKLTQRDIIRELAAADPGIDNGALKDGRTHQRHIPRENGVDDGQSLRGLGCDGSAMIVGDQTGRGVVVDECGFRDFEQPACHVDRVAHVRGKHAVVDCGLIRAHNNDTWDEDGLGWQQKDKKTRNWKIGIQENENQQENGNDSKKMKNSEKMETIQIQKMKTARKWKRFKFENEKQRENENDSNSKNKKARKWKRFKFKKWKTARKWKRFKFENEKQRENENDSNSKNKKARK